MNKDDLQPWQEQLIVDIESYSNTNGFRAGEMSIMMGGRRTGKSMLTQQWMQQWMDVLNQPKPIVDIVLAEGRVYGNRYYTASPEGGNWREMEAWCAQTFGDHGGAIWGADPNRAPVPNERWYMNNKKFWFRNLKDRDWFVMRWSAT